MIKELKLKPGISVADIGSGNGYHTLMMAKIIGEKGQAYAVDIQPEMLIMLEERAKKAGMENIKLIENRFWDADLPEKSVDFVLMADVYHEFFSSSANAIKYQKISQRRWCGLFT